MKLYIAVFNWYETYSVWLHACSDDRELLEEQVNKWIESEKRCGNSHEAFINEIEVGDHIILIASSAAICDIEPVIWFETDVELYNNDFEVEVERIIKVNKMIAKPDGLIPNNVYSARFIRRR